MNRREDEFYVGYLAAAPSGIGRFVRDGVVLLVLASLGVAGLAAWGQSAFPPKVFEWNQPREFDGWLEAKPYPHLVLPRAGATDAWSRYLLVAPGKFGADAEVAGFEGRWVSLEGSLVYREDQTMLELVSGSIQISEPSVSAPAGATEDLGERTLVGEVVDSKCFWGVMAPGSAKPHRACATRCISGGIPPVLAVRDASGAARYFLLVGNDGRAVNREVLPFVAEPVEITGRLERQGSLLVLYSEPSTYRRLEP